MEGGWKGKILKIMFVQNFSAQQNLEIFNNLGSFKYMIEFYTLTWMYITEMVWRTLLAFRPKFSLFLCTNSVPGIFRELARSQM